MNRRQALKVSVAAATGATLATVASAQSNDDDSQLSLDIVMALVCAMGRGDMAKMDGLMADDMVWLNEGDLWLSGDIQRKLQNHKVGKHRYFSLRRHCCYIW